MELFYRTDAKLLESLQKTIRETSKSDIVVGVCYRPPEQVKEAEEFFFKQQDSLWIIDLNYHGGI